MKGILERIRSTKGLGKIAALTSVALAVGIGFGLLAARWASGPGEQAVSQVRETSQSASVKPVAEEALSQQPAVMAEAPILEQSATKSETASSATNTTTTKRGGWTVNCTEGGGLERKFCTADFRVVAENRGTILVWLIGYNDSGQMLNEFFGMTDVAIKPGISVRLDEGKAHKAEYETCGQKSCKASLPMDADFFAALKEAKKARIEVTSIKGQVVAITIDIPGIAMVLQDLAAQ